MVWRPIYYYLRTPVFPDPWCYWLIREAFRNCHLRRRQVRVCPHLRFLPRRLHWAKTLAVNRNHHPIRCHALRRHLPDCSSLNHKRESAKRISETRWDRRNRHDLLFRSGMGPRLELDPISDWR